jgi:hypothetical protein
MTAAISALLSGNFVVRFSFSKHVLSFRAGHKGERLSCRRQGLHRFGKFRPEKFNRAGNCSKGISIFAGRAKDLLTEK